MPYLQRHRLTIDSDLDDDSTWRYKLPSVGKYTCFELDINCNRYATRTLNTVCYTIEDCITRIEMLEAGAKIIHSLTGLHHDAMNYWDFGTPNRRRYRQEGDTDNQVSLFLLGGRHIADQEYGFDMSKLAETYINYTYDLSEGVADYFKADDHDVKLYGYRWMGEDTPEFTGHMRTQELARWTCSAANALKTINVPVGNRIRRLGIQALTRAKTIGGTFTRAELRANEGEYSPIIIESPMDWAMAEVAEYGLNNQIGGIDYIVADTLMDLPYRWGYYGQVLLTPFVTTAHADVNCRFITLPAAISSGTAAAGECVFDTTGFGFQKCARLGFEHDDNPLKYLKTDHLGSLDLILTEAGSARDASAFMQDVVMY